MTEPKTPRPWQRLSSEILVDNPWHRYRMDRYVLRDGSEGRYYYVDMPGSCGIVPLFPDGRTVLLRVHRYVLGRELWEFPIGGMRTGDDPLAVARDELRQEAGLVAERWDLLGRFAPYKGVSNEVTHFFLARELSWVPQEHEVSEGISVHPMSLEEARSRLLDQELPDGQSVTGLALLDRFLRGK